jgi:hypothetical protein
VRSDFGGERLRLDLKAVLAARNGRFRLDAALERTLDDELARYDG